MSHDTEPEGAKLVSIVEREAEEAYPTNIGTIPILRKRSRPIVTICRKPT